MATQSDLQRTLQTLHSELDHTYHRWFEKIGQIQVMVQELRRGMPEVYERVQEMLRNSEFMAENLDDNYDRDTIESWIEEIRSSMSEIESNLTNISDGLG